jgi:cell division protein FtsQ
MLTRSRRRFLRKCALILIMLLFFTLILYSSLGEIIYQYNYYISICNQYISNLLLDNGFCIDKIIITGNKFTDKEYILNLVDSKRPILYIGLSKLAYRIKSTNKWIKNVRIHRILPNTLHIDVDEYEPFAILEDDNKLSVIDSQGTVIIDIPFVNENFFKQNFVVISGQNALLNLKFVKSILECKTQLSRNISSFVFISNRRWDIILKSGLTIKLPEEHPYKALDLLHDIDLSKWTVVDMRVIDKIFVKR